MKRLVKTSKGIVISITLLNPGEYDRARESFIRSAAGMACHQHTAVQCPDRNKQRREKWNRQ